MRPNGDMYDNYIIRIDGIRQSLRILEQAVRPVRPDRSIPKSRSTRYTSASVLWPDPKGDWPSMSSNGKPNPWRYHRLLRPL